MLRIMKNNGCDFFYFNVQKFRKYLKSLKRRLKFSPKSRQKNISSQKQHSFQDLRDFDNKWENP